MPRTVAVPRTVAWNSDQPLDNAIRRQRHLDYVFLRGELRDLLSCVVFKALRVIEVDFRRGRVCWSLNREHLDHLRCSWPSSKSLYWVEISTSPSLCCVRQEVSVAHCGERAENQPVHSLAVPPSTMKRRDHFHNHRTSKLSRKQHQVIVFGKKELRSCLRDRRVRCLSRRVCKSTSCISRSRCP